MPAAHNSAPARPSQRRMNSGRLTAITPKIAGSMRPV